MIVYVYHRKIFLDNKQSWGPENLTTAHRDVDGEASRQHIDGQGAEQRGRPQRVPSYPLVVF